MGIDDRELDRWYSYRWSRYKYSGISSTDGVMVGDDTRDINIDDIDVVMNTDRGIDIALDTDIYR